MSLPDSPPSLVPAASHAARPAPSPAWPAALVLVLAVGAALRLCAIGYGLPGVFNSDEPHVVNVAVSFGSGTLNPHLFKYPTLWMYLLFGAYGAYFALWSGFGLARSAAEFASLFVWQPEVFFLLARLLSAAVSLAGVRRAYKAGVLLWGHGGGLVAAALLAVAPGLIVAAHAAKPESFMFYLACWAWFFAARHHAEGAERDLVLCGVFSGLAASAQYTALPLGILPVAAWLSRCGLPPAAQAGGLPPAAQAGSAFAAAAAKAVAAVPLAFVAGSPFILLDFSAFWATVGDMRALEAAGAPPVGLGKVLENLASFSGSWLPAGAALGLAAFWLLRRRPSTAVLLLVPAAAYLLVLSRSAEGGWQRYLFAVFPGLALAAGALTAVGREEGEADAPAPALALVVLLCVPGLLESRAFDALHRLPDTRTLATEWCRANIPEGGTVLLDQEHASPRLHMTREEVARLLEHTERTGHPKRRYYRAMLDGHPGGGWEVYRVLRDYKDLRTWPGHAAFSAQGQAVLDARPGLAAAREAGVEFVVLTSFGADPERSPDLRGFLAETEREGRMLAEFAPAPGRVVGPRIRVFALR